MCGITGVWSLDGSPIGEKAVKRFIEVTIGSMSRGRDATGIMFDAEDGHWEIYKQGVQASEFFSLKDIKSKEFISKLAKATKLFGHVRQGTSGSPNQNVNNHPVIGQKFVVIHNGVVHMDKVPDYKYKGEVDTENIVAALDTYGLKEGLGKVSGSASLIILDKQTKDVWFWRKSNPMKVVYDKAVKNCVFVISDETFMEYSYYQMVGDVCVERDGEPLLVGQTKEEWLYRVEEKDGRVGLVLHGEIKGKSWNTYSPVAYTNKGKSRKNEHDYDSLLYYRGGMGF